MTFSELLTQLQPFYRFGSEHWTWLLASAAYTFFWIWLGRQQVSNAAQQGVAYIFTLLSIVTWSITTYAHVYWDFRFFEKGYSLQSALPFHLCYFLNFFFLFMHLFRSARIFDFWYPWVMAACFQALITPDLDEAFPHYYNVRYFVVHATLVLHALYGALVYGFRPDKWTPLRALAMGNVYFWAVHLLNLKLKTNFMYTMESPPGTILDLLGDYKLLKANAVALVLFYIVCSPFWIGKKRTF